MENSEIKSVIEALIFVSEEPMTPELITMVLEETGFKKKEVTELVEEIKSDYNENCNRGIQVVEVAGGYQFRTKQQMADWIKRLNVPKPVRLSQPAMETLAIIAYRQPAVRSQIEDIRGVDSGGVLKTLLERGLIRIIGKSDDPGNPLVYGTSKAFLEMFALNSLKELPTLKEIERLEVQERVGDLSKEHDDSEVARGVSEVVAEYKEGVLEVGIDLEKEAEDQAAIDNLETKVKTLRKMEKVIFPKPKEEFTAVEKEGAARGSYEQGTTQEQRHEQSSDQQPATSDEDTPPQNFGSVD